MHIILAILGVVGTAAVWIMRMRAAAQASQFVWNAASEVIAAAKRFHYQPKQKENPIDAIDSPELALAALGAGFLELGGLPTRDQRDAMHRSLARAVHMTLNDAEEMSTLARWIVNEAGGPRANMERIAKRLRAMSGADRFPQMMEIFQAIAAADGTGLNDHQRGALEDIKTAFDIT